MNKMAIFVEGYTEVVFVDKLIREVAAENARKVHPGMEIVKVSCLTGNGLHEWMLWLGERRRAYKSLLQKTAS